MREIFKVFLSFSSDSGSENQQGIFQQWSKQRQLEMWLTCMLFKDVCFDGYILEIFLIILTSNNHLH